MCVSGFTVYVKTVKVNVVTQFLCHWGVLSPLSLCVRSYKSGAASQRNSVIQPVPNKRLPSHLHRGTQEKSIC